MKVSTVVLASIVTLPLVLLSVPGFAASAHNIQFGTHTANVYDTQATEASKQKR